MRGSGSLQNASDENAKGEHEGHKKKKAKVTKNFSVA